MIDTSDTLELECSVGEDIAWQFYWSDDDGPIPITEPALADVKDSNGQIALRFSTAADEATQAKLTVIGQIGFFQFTVPRVLSRTLVPGRYVFDLYGCVADSAAPFPSQMVQILSGWVVVNPRTTHIESAPEATTSPTPG